MIRKFCCLALLVVWVLVSACTPQATPVPLPAPTPLQKIPAVSPTSNLSPPTSQDAAWVKVVETSKKEGRLTVYTVHLYGDMGIQMAQTFFERTGIRVDTITATGSTLVERIRTERRVNSQVADVVTAAGSWVLMAKQDGLTQKVGDIPEIKDESLYRFAPQLDKDGHMLSLQLITQSPWINTKVIKPGTEPKSWRDLLKPEWKGKIGVSDPDSSASANYTYYGLTSRGKLDQSYFVELGKQDLKFQLTSRMEGDALTRGQISMSLSQGLAANSIMPFLQEGAPLKAIDMAEGIVTYRSGGVALIQGTPHPNASRVFVNWLFSKEGQMIFHKNSLTVGFRKDVPSFIPPEGQVNPVNPIMMTLEDEQEITKIQRDRTVGKILRGG